MSNHRDRPSNPQSAPTPPVTTPTDAAIEDLPSKLTPEQEDKLRGGLANRGPNEGIQVN